MELVAEDALVHFLHDTLEILETLRPMQLSQLSHIKNLFGDIDDIGDIAILATFAISFFQSVDSVKSVLLPIIRTHCHLWGPRHKPSHRLFVVGRAEAMARFMSPSDISERHLLNANVSCSLYIPYMFINHYQTPSLRPSK